ncbi:CAMK/CAMKL/MELK protein kinase [Salpingoeca rosetta]|uniref:non-specific serine/threonine protein kinase n=1 Tax=Salpingoeca rosetta (strain ATCC 50818 / BSB-021) TaxID=946362 RepID=F2UAS4_SALR5|nr:CAMK/CAMKL/MELK protein kinase [Salpingoeca rosetta]EGD73490.1 CAMK/CAMKL/MELK protein kinase [Salpingoeca rosetta]|eukprot:XP_004993772.1 CAMK/CAMKL/MELK protein kinase [Salpingoeca rosetta]
MATRTCAYSSPAASMQTGFSHSPSGRHKYPPEITDHYEVKDTIGTGGFAKVKIARHKLTHTKVAIKIMLKEKLRQTNDLKRVALEIEALKDLKHQNICRLYQVIETEDRYFLVLEYAPGGELFDYIVARSRCKEQEARKFFRQIVSAVHYMHGKGYVHRDLKPENLLLDADRNIKLIDFGLIAKTSSIQEDMLSTCCGSAAYAAPELIRGEKYHGAPADVWSLGILLYALLCGFLPFDDDNTQRLYKLIQRGTYEIPPWLSKESEDFIACMLRHRPEHRISLDGILSHPWMLKGLDVPRIDPSSTIEEHGGVLHSESVQELARYYGTSMTLMEQWIKEYGYGVITANYELVKQRFQDNKPIKLPRGKGTLPAEKAIVLLKLKETRRSMDGRSSPLATSASVSRNTSNVSITTEDVDKHHQSLSSPEEEDQVRHDVEPAGMATAPDRVMSSPPRPHPRRPAKDSLAPQHMLASGSPRSPGRGRSRTVGASDTRNVQNMLLTSPKRADAFGGSMQHMAQSDDDDDDELKRHTSNPSLSPAKKRQSEGAPHIPPMQQERRGSALKAGLGSLARSLFNVFGSRNLTEPRVVKGLFNADSTSSKTPEAVLEEICRVLADEHCDFTQRGFHVRAKFLDDDDKHYITINFEVCRIDGFADVVGVRPKRIKGDTWRYKKKLEDILRQLHL